LVTQIFSNAPATFVRMMHRIFLKHQDFMIVFFDDILIFSRSKKEHENHLRIVFKLIKENHLYANIDKSSFFQSEIENLRHIFFLDGIRVNPQKIETIREIGQLPRLCNMM